MNMSEQEARDKCTGQDSCTSCHRYMDDCDGKEDLHGLIAEYGDDLDKFGFPEYTIDFSDVNSKDAIALCDWIKKRVEGRE